MRFFRNMLERALQDEQAAKEQMEASLRRRNDALRHYEQNRLTPVKLQAIQDEESAKIQAECKAARERRMQAERALEEAMR